MNEIITADASESLLPEAARAVQITERIKANGRTAVNAVCAIGKDLRTMKIDKLYTQLGYSGFEDYAEKEFQMHKRQAYQYISVFERLGQDFVQSNAQLGITKLALLASANPEDRAEVMQNEDVQGMTTKELEKLLSDYKQQGEQLSLFQQEKADAEKAYSEESDRVQELVNDQVDKNRKIFELEQRIKELEEKPKDVEVATKEVIKEVPDKKTEKKLKDTEKELKDAKARIKLLENTASVEASAVKAEYEEKVLELQKRLKAAEKPSESSDKSSFKSMLASCYKEITGLIEFVKNADAEEKAAFIKKCFEILNLGKDALSKIDPCIGVEGSDDE